MTAETMVFNIDDDEDEEGKDGEDGKKDEGGKDGEKDKDVDKEDGEEEEEEDKEEPVTVRNEPPKPADTPHAVPPAEAPPASAEPVVPVVGAEGGSEQPTPEGASETPQQKGFFKKIREGFKGVADKFASHFKGEVRAKDEKDYQATTADLGKTVATAVISIAASRFGVKFFSDLPTWMTQKYLTKKERERIKDVLKQQDTEQENVSESVALEAKKEALTKAIQESKYLTKEKKEALINKIIQNVEAFKQKDSGMKKVRDQIIAGLLDEAIQTRVKNTTVLKEGLNTALILSGVATARTVAYTAVSLYERHMKVRKETKEGKREGSYLNEFIVKGMTETWDKLKGGGAKTKKDRMLNRVQGASVLFRGLAIGTLAIPEITGTGGLSKVVEESIKALQEKGAARWAGENIGKSEIGRLAGAIHGVFAGESAVQAAEAVAGSASAVGSVDVDSQEPTSTAETIMDEDTSTDFEDSQIELGTVHKNEGIVQILTRQLKDSPEKFGFKGDVNDQAAVDAWARTSALDTAREAGIVRAGGDTRLAATAIDKLSVLAKPTDGKIEIVFLDTTTNEELTAAGAGLRGFTYEHGVHPGEIQPKPDVTESTRGATQPDVETPAVPASGEVSHEFAGGALKLNMNENGEIESLSPDIDKIGDKSSLSGMISWTRDNPHLTETVEEITKQTIVVENESRLMVCLQAAIEKLEQTGQGHTAEAHYLQQTLRDQLDKIQESGSLQDVYKTGGLQDLLDDATEDDTSIPETIINKEIRVPGIGKIEFNYDDAGKPSMDESKWSEMIRHAKPMLQQKADKLLVKDWLVVVKNVYLESESVELAGPVYLMNEALKELRSVGQDQSGEAGFIREQLKAYLENHGRAFNADNEIVKQAFAEVGRYADVSAGTNATDAGATYEAPDDSDNAGSREPAADDVDEGGSEVPESEPLNKFKSEQGTVKFTHDRTGKVDRAFIIRDSYNSTRADTETALNRLGLTREQVEDHFEAKKEEWEPMTHSQNGLPMPVERSTTPNYVGGRHYSGGIDTSPRASSARLIDSADLLLRQETALEEMIKEGLSNTPEYEQLRIETGALRDDVRETIVREFPPR